MIFYFTGTGNSLWVAKALSEALGEQLVSIAEELHKEKDGWGYPVRPDEKNIVCLSCAFLGTGGVCDPFYLSSDFKRIYWTIGLFRFYLWR